MRKRFDAVLVLGLQLGPDDAPTPELNARADAAAQAYARLTREYGSELPLVACGGIMPGHSAAEADVLAGLLIDRGVPEGRIVRERQSTTTMENMRFAARLLGGAKGKRVLVATSDYHVRRAVWTARRVGFKAKGAAAPLLHDAAWKTLRLKELCFTLDLLMGWQDEGKCRPQAMDRLFERVFGKR